ncbi:carbon storage regulator [Paenibacillus selenitireducens]|uniref:Translational regulator CsrA n=1 Tax=Paenibacillus selenitireducens TaxID=1324314 RepID=A0A1T2X711_9BACL|nr:carbon storage regulator CsrA [Paenibacillus selenitireducens]OPA75660.1 carbon storage regulator [Paenibacillus selenitireducens]
MLILTRKKGQSIVINDNIEIIISAIDGDQIKIGINAPKNVKIYRKEVIEAIQESNMEAMTSTLNMDLLKNMMKSE